MMEDRDYMRSDYRPGPRWQWGAPSASVWLMISLVAAFFVQYGAHLNVDYFALSLSGMRAGYVWQLLTFQFLHAGMGHLVGNLLGIFFFARPVEQRLGKTRFLTLYFLSGIAGGLFQVLLMWVFPKYFGGYVVGASAGIFGAVAAFCLMEPDAFIYLYFLLPLRAKYLLIGEGVIALCGVLWPSGNVANGAHLGGMLFAVAYMRWGLNASWSFSEWNPIQRKIRRERMLKAATVAPAPQKFRKRSKPDEARDLPSEEFISKQVDPILDKISAHGIQSLTEREREILQAARARMSKR